MTLGEPLVVRPAPGRDRDRVRAEIGARGLAAGAIEQIVRGAMERTPPALVERARSLLRRFFSAASWRIDDDTALASIVGPGSGWQQVVLVDELVMAFGWKAGSFRIEVEQQPIVVAVDTPGTAGTDRDTTAPASGEIVLVGDTAPSDLGETFDGPVVAEAQPQPRIVAFLTGAGTGGMSRNWIRSAAETHDARLKALFGAFPAISGVMLAPGCYMIEVHDGAQWHDVMLPVLAYVGEHLATARAPVVNRELERARDEFAALDVTSARGMAKVRDALTSPDPMMRCEAVARIGVSDPFAAERAWRAALDDTSRLVRRAAVKAMAEARREVLRPLLERACTDNDSCTRYYAVRGLDAIGAAKSRLPLDRLANDGDARVRLAVDAARTRR